MATRKSSSILRSVGKAKPEPADLKTRADIGLRATWQLSSIVEGIIEIALTNDFDELPVNGKLLALAMRAKHLNDLLSSALGDPDEKVVFLLHRLGEGDVTDAEAASA